VSARRNAQRRIYSGTGHPPNLECDGRFKASRTTTGRRRAVTHGVSEAGQDPSSWRRPVMSSYGHDVTDWWLRCCKVLWNWRIAFWNPAWRFRTKKDCK
jgi:hypothetical protein